MVMGQGSAGLFWNYVLKRNGAARVITVEPVEHRRSLGPFYGSDEGIDPGAAGWTEAVPGRYRRHGSGHRGGGGGQGGDAEFCVRSRER